MFRMRSWFLLGMTLLLAGWSALAVAAEGPYSYLPAAALKAKIESGEPVNLVDIQVRDEFSAHHLPGALATYAYPVKSDEDRSRLEAVLTELQANSAAVVIVCPRGAGGAKRAYDHLLGQGVAAERLYILEKGQEGWPFPELTEKGGN